MTYLDRIRRLGIRVDWCLILVGIEGLRVRSLLIEGREVVAFAEEELARSSSGDPVLAELVAVLDLADATLGELGEVVRPLARRFGGSRERAERAWALAILDEAHDRANANESNPLYAILDLEHAWQSVMDEIPERLIGRGGLFNSEAEANAYFSEGNGRELFARSRAWVAQEAARIAK